MADVVGRIMGIDLGERRIGVALSDPTAFLASAHSVVASQGRARDVAAILEIAEREEVVAIVLGMPVSLDGTYGPQAEKVRRFGEALAAATTIPVSHWDERFTTVEAQRYLRESGMRRAKRAATIDAEAAAVLLQGYLDHRWRR